MTADVITTEEYSSQLYCHWRSFHHCEVWMTLAPQSKGPLKDVW